MESLVQQRCFNHAAREAVARCPECRQFYCRECVTEHEDRVLCAACLKKLATIPLTHRPAFLTAKRSVQLISSFVIGWFVFFLIGESLIRIPTEFHEGSIWQVPWLEKR